MKKAIIFIFTLMLTVFTLLSFTAFAKEEAFMSWEFDSSEDETQWFVSNAEGSVKNGAYYCTAVKSSTRFDPALLSTKVSLDADVYKYIAVGIKIEIKDKTEGTMSLFFRAPRTAFTDISVKRIGIANSTEFKEYLFDMSTVSKWTGIIDQIRIDPFEDEGDFAVDYIKIYKDNPMAESTTKPTVTNPNNPVSTTVPQPTESKPAEPPKENNPFSEKNKFTVTTFSDVSDGMWYYKYVANAYKIGLVNGITEKTFEPDGTLSVAQAITLAARVNHIYNGGDGIIKEENSKNWFDAYVNYAAEKKIIDKGNFSDMNLPISRREMGIIFANALPNDYYTPINRFSAIPDIAAQDKGFNEILKLYNAGIITGVDDIGTYNPDAHIKRSEVAAIITRVALKTERIRKLTVAEVEQEEKAARE